MNEPRIDRARPSASRSRLSGPVGLALVGLALAVLAPASSLGAQGRGIRFQRLNIEQGLSQGTVNCILQDRYGFLWLGTQDGLNRYDGADFEVFKHDPGDASSLANSWILELLEDGAGDLWIATQGGGLDRWRRQSNEIEHFRHRAGDPASLASDEVQALVEAGGALWVGTGDGGLDRLDPQTGAVAHFRHDPADPASLGDDRVRALHLDRGGSLWVGTLGGLDRYVPETGGFVHFRHDPDDPSSLSDDGVRAILEDREGALWVGTFGGLNRLDPLTGTFTRFRHDPERPESLAADRVRALYEDRDGRLWVGTDRGLDLFDRAAGTFTHYRHQASDPTSLSADRVMSIYQDRGGVMWIGTQEGVNKWSPRAWVFAHYRHEPWNPNSLADDNVLAVAEGPQGELWVGTNGHGLDRVDRATGEVTHFRSGDGHLGDDIVTALAVDRRGSVWIGTLGGGLDRLDPDGTFAHFRHHPDDPASLGADGVMALYEDRQGALWAGTFGGGLNRYERGSGGFRRWRHDPDNPTSLSSDRVSVLGEDGRGLWVGTLGGGLNLFDHESGRFARFEHDPRRADSLSNDNLMAIHAAPDGTLWVGTQAGLNRLLSLADGQASFRRYFERDGLPNDFIYSVYSDRRGRLWMSTNRGISSFDPETGSFRNFDVSHGLQGDEFNVGAHHQNARGELFLGGVGGLNVFDPERVEPSSQPPPVVFTSFSKHNRPAELERPIFETDAVRLDHRDSMLYFAFAALDFTAPEKNRYRYRLEGLDERWVDHGNQRRATFTNLDPGRYVLHVQAANHDGVWNREGAKVEILVAPPPWRTWWAYLLYALALAAAVAAYLRAQQRELERERAQVRERERLLAEREELIAELEAKNAELERFNYTVSHDLKSPLVTIKGFLGLLERDTDRGDRERVEHDIRRISSAADRMHRLLDELLELSRVGHQAQTLSEVSLLEVAEEASRLLDHQLTQGAVAIEIDPDLPIVRGDRSRLLELYQNLLENAAKYMGEKSAPRIEVGSEERGDETVLFVRDNGLGIDPRYHRKIFGLFERLSADRDGTGVGLALVKRIVEMHGGRIWVESRGMGYGSTFCFTLAGVETSERRRMAEAVGVGSG